MDSSGATFNALLLAIPFLGVLIVVSRIRNLRRVGAFADVGDDANAGRDKPKGLPFSGFEHALMLALYACILGVLVLILMAFIAISGGAPRVVGWRGYVPTVVIAGMVTVQGALLWRAAKKHLPRILDEGAASPNERLP